jgi:hypothetical protein
MTSLFQLRNIFINKNFSRSRQTNKTKTKNINKQNLHTQHTDHHDFHPPPTLQCFHRICRYMLDDKISDTQNIVFRPCLCYKLNNFFDTRSISFSTTVYFFFFFFLNERERKNKKEHNRQINKNEQTPLYFKRTNK